MLSVNKLVIHCAIIVVESIGETLFVILARK